jgi:hypothetical protein
MMTRHYAIAACKANPLIPFMLLWQLALRVPVKIAIQDWWGLADVITIALTTLLALIYAMHWLAERDRPAQIERHIRSGPDPYLDDALRRSVERMARDVSKRMDGGLK